MLNKKIFLSAIVLLFSSVMAFSQQIFNYKGTVSNVKTTMTLESGVWKLSDYLYRYVLLR
jgi:hypothetical protein